MQYSNRDYEGGVFFNMKNTILFGKICTTIIVIAFVIIPVLYAAQGHTNIINLFHRDIAVAVTPETQQYIPVQNGPPKPNMIWLEANAVRTIFEEASELSQVDSLFGPAATTTKILEELNKGPKFVHLATHGKVESDGRPALKTYDNYLHPSDIRRNVVEDRMKNSLVVLSACYSLYNYHVEDYRMNFGYVFVKWAGVHTVIGSKGVIDSLVLYWFALDFYGFLLFQHESIADAYRDAHNKVESSIRQIIDIWFIALDVFLFVVLPGASWKELLKEPAKVLFYFLLGLATVYGEDILKDYLAEALFHLSNLVAYDVGSIVGSGGGGGSPYPPVVM